MNITAFVILLFCFNFSVEILHIVDHDSVVIKEVKLKKIENVKKYLYTNFTLV